MNVHSQKAPQMWPKSGADGGQKLSAVPFESPRLLFVFDLAGFREKTGPAFSQAHFLSAPLKSAS
jgi:hypothetical protein